MIKCGRVEIRRKDYINYYEKDYSVEGEILKF